MSDTISPLRKAAIIIDSLDRRAADALLAQLAPETAARVRQVRWQLGTVESRERERIIAEFLQRGLAASEQASADVAVDESLAAKIAVAEDSSPDLASGQSASPVPFEFLQQASAELLAEHFAAEHPQTISLVLAHLSARRAAEVLRRLPTELQPEVLRRLARLDEADPAVVAEIEQELERSWFARLRQREQRAAGPAAVEAILGAGSREQRPAWLQALEQSDPQLARQLGHPATRSGPRLDAALRDHDEDAVGPRWREPVIPAPAVVSATPPRDLLAATAESVVGWGTNFDDLMALDDDALAKVFQAAEPQVALLALTGASPALADRILRRLSGTEARQLEREMERLGPIRLQDVETAQQQVVVLARQLVPQGHVAVPTPPKIAAAA